MGIEKIMGIFTRGKVKKVVDDKGTTVEVPPVEVVERSWGKFEVISRKMDTGVGVLTQVKKLHINPECSISFQYHVHRSEVWKVMDGEGIAIVGGNYTVLKPGIVVCVPPNTVHKIWAGKTGLTILETWVGDDLREEDIVRL